jgi:glycosyltransferase involved in cell wall biosynthesis
MLKGEKIICISFSSWDGPYTKSTVQLMSLLSKDNDVLFIEYPYTFKDLINGFLGKRDISVKRLLGVTKRLQVIETPFDSIVHTLVIPPTISFNFIESDLIYKLLLYINRLIYQYSVKKALKKLNWINPIIINAYNPVFGNELIGSFNEKAIIYYCYDGYFTDKRGIRAYYADMAFSSRVDGVIVSSEYLSDQKRKYNNKIYVIKNGVDYDLFLKHTKKTITQNAARKKIGYIGSIDQRFDIELVKHLVESLSECIFELVGEVRNIEAKTILSKYNNVIFLPAVGASEVPELLKEFDVGIIPYLCTEMNRSIYPLKINEYLAVGLPVVMTNFAELKEFEGYIGVAESKADFLKKIVFALENDSVLQIEKRRDFASQNSWTARAECFSKAIVEILELKQSKNNKKLMKP